MSITHALKSSVNSRHLRCDWNRGADPDSLDDIGEKPGALAKVSPLILGELLPYAKSEHFLRPGARAPGHMNETYESI